MAVRGTKNYQWGLERHHRILWQFDQLLQNKFFDSSTPFVRKVDNGGDKKKGKIKIMTELVAIATQPPNSTQLYNVAACANSLKTEKKFFDH